MEKLFILVIVCLAIVGLFFHFKKMLKGKSSCSQCSFQKQCEEKDANSCTPSKN